MLLHQRQHAGGERLQREGARLDRGRDALPRGVQEVAAERVLRRERDRVQEPVEPSPARDPSSARDGVDLRGFVRVHLQHVGRGRAAACAIFSVRLIARPKMVSTISAPCSWSGLRRRERDRLAASARR